MILKIFNTISIKVQRMLKLGHQNYAPFVLIGTYRTGSNLFIYSIKNHPEVISFSEIFLPNKMFWGDSINGYFPFQNKRLMVERNNNTAQFITKRVFRKYPKGIKAVGFKVFYQHLMKEGHILPVMEWLEQHPEVKVIHLIRENLLDHYMSQVLVSKTGIKVDKIDSKKHSELDFQVELNQDSLLNHFRYMENNTKWFNEKLLHHEKLELSYENLVRDFEGSQQQIYGFLGVKPIIVKMATKKLNTTRHSERISNWKEIQKSFEGSKYEWMFED
jgi:hypothetical protein